MERFHPVNFDHIGACAHNISAHGVQEVGNVHNMGFLRSVFNHSEAFCQNTGQNGIDCRANGDLVHIDGRTTEPSFGRRGRDKAALYVHISAKGFEAFDMQVDGANPQITAAGHGHLRCTKAAQQRANQVIRCAHPAREFVRYTAAANFAAVDFKCVFVDGAHIGTQFLQNFQNNSDIADLRNIFNTAGPIHQQGGRNDCDSGVFCAADFNFSKQRMAAVNNILLQDCTFFGKE